MQFHIFKVKISGVIISVLGYFSTEVSLLTMFLHQIEQFHPLMSFLFFFLFLRDLIGREAVLLHALVPQPMGLDKLWEDVEQFCESENLAKNMKSAQQPTNCFIAQASGEGWFLLYNT